MSVNVKVLGGGCSKCAELLKNAKEAAANLSIEAEFEYITDMREIVKFGLMSMPALIINGKAVASGKVLKPKEIEKFF